MYDTLPSNTFSIPCHDIVYAVEFSPYEWCSSLLAIGTNSRVTIYSCNFEEEFEGEKNFKLVRDFQNGCQVRSIAFCPDTAYRLPETVDQLRFVTAGIDKKLRIFTSDIVNKDTVKVLDGHTDFINDVACNPANDDIFYLASTSDDLTCKLWSSNGEESARFQLGAPGMSVCIHEREHRKLMVAQKNGIIKIFSLDLQQQILSLDCGVVPLMSADWSRHDDVIIAAAAGTEWLLFHSSNSSYPLERRQAHTEGTKEIKWSKSHPTLLATLGRPGRQIKVFSTRHNQVPLNTSLQVAYGLSWHHSLPVLAVGGDQKVHLFAIDPNRSQSAT